MLTAEGLDVSAALAWAERYLGRLTQVGELTGGWTSTMLGLVPERGDPAVLRLMTKEPWRTHGPGLTTRESQVQRMLVDGPVPAPRSLALDADGAACGQPAHLMSLLPGAVDLDLVEDEQLEVLASLLDDIHDLRPTIEVREYQPWAWEAKYVVPGWADDPGTWERAFDVLRRPPPAYEPCFLHRDFQPRNVLWLDGAITGVVDWVETSIGPAWLDVAHCSTNIALLHGTERADAFAEAYARRSGREPDAFWDVLDVVGFLPPPGRPGFIQDPAQQQRLEERLSVVLERLG